MKYIVVSGGSISGIGKGRLSCSIGQILQSYGHKITFLKIDPYLNFNAGKMMPSQHGETFVCEDGTEADLDLGSYERSCSLILSSANSVTTGKILYEMIKEEKEGLHNGTTLQFCSTFYERSVKVLENLAVTPVKYIHNGTVIEYLPEIAIIELGGTVGDLEAQFFVKTLERFLSVIPMNNKVLVTIEYLIDFHGTKKTRIIQNSLHQMKNCGMENNILVYRSNTEMTTENKSKISLNCGVDIDNIIWAKDCSSVYEISKMFYENGLFKAVCRELNLKTTISQQFSLIEKYDHLIRKYNRTCRIGLISRYNQVDDPYYSLEEMIFVAAKLHLSEVEIVYINSIKLEENDDAAFEMLRSIDGLICPGGFGAIGYVGKMNAIRFARENDIPFLGICLGFQLSLIEFSRNVVGLDEANSSEFDPTTKYPVVDKIENMVCKNTKGPVFLGNYPVNFWNDFQKIYSKERGQFRFRHSYGFNINYRQKVEQAGLMFTGACNENRMVAFKLDKLKFFVGVQYHPELSSKPESIDPIITSFMKAVVENKFS